MKKRVITLLLAALVLFSAPLAASAAEKLPYQDVSIGDWYFQPVTFCTELGLMNGIGQGQFAPVGKINRAMFVTILHRLAGSPEASSGGFTDVPEGSFFAEAVAWAAEMGIVNGTGGTSFSPERSILRQDMACMLAPYLVSIDSPVLRGDECEQAFLDMDQVSGYAREAVALMRRTGLFQGDENSNFRPLDTANRAEAAALFTRLSLELGQIPTKARLETADGSAVLSQEDTIWLYSHLIGLSWEEGLYAEYVPTHTLILWNGEYRFCLPADDRIHHINYVSGDACMGSQQITPLLMDLIYERFAAYIP